MESLLIHPQDAAQLKEIKAYLHSLKIAFEVKKSGLLKSGLPPHVVAGIAKGMAEDDAGQTVSFEEFRQKHFLSNR